MASIDQLKSRIGQIKAELRELSRQLEEEECRAAGLSKGCVLREMSSRIGGEKVPTGRMGAFVCRQYGGARVRLQKKDGSIGERCANFFTFEPAS